MTRLVAFPPRSRGGLCRNPKASAYADWIVYKTSAPATARDRLRRYIGDLNVLVSSPDISADGKSISRSGLQQQVQCLMTQERELSAAVEGNGGVGYAAFDSNPL